MIITDPPYESSPAAVTNLGSAGDHCHPQFYFEDNDTICTGAADTVHCTDLSCDKSPCEIESDCDECHSNSTDCSVAALGANEMPLDIVAAAAAFIAHESEHSCCMQQQPLMLACSDCPLPRASSPGNTSTATAQPGFASSSCGAGATPYYFNNVYQPRVSNSRPNRPYQHHPVSCCPSSSNTAAYRKPVQATAWVKKDFQPLPSTTSSTSNESVFSSCSNSVYSTPWDETEDYQQAEGNSEISTRNEINNSSCAGININDTSDAGTTFNTNDDNNSSGTNPGGYIDFDNHSSASFRGQPPRLSEVETRNSNSAKRHFEEISKGSPCNWEHCTGELTELNSLLEHLKKDHNVVLQQQTPPISQTSTPNWDTSSGGLCSPSIDNPVFSSQHHQKPQLYPQQDSQQGPQKRPRQGPQHDDHRQGHLQGSHQATQPGMFQCEWKNCNFNCHKVELFMTHVRLAHVQGMVGKLIIPPASTPTSLLDKVGTDTKELPVSSETHICLWENCNANDANAPLTVCRQTFGSTQVLNQHVIESHIGLRKNNYVCRWRDCDRHKRPFSQRQKIHRHLITHTKHKPYTCEVCQNSFSEAVVLKQHMRVHSGERPFPCKVCGKRFAASTAVSVHMRTHTGEKPLKCRFDGCEKRFSESSNLAKHMKTHLVEKKYGCTEPDCTKRFVRHDQLQRHLKTHENRLMRIKLKQEAAAAALFTANLKNPTT